ncbi:hypothetical protein K1719_015835 [Acacia pycnantha]|nr:hypothetical protein K1719_015835 [Acacia pycnantha]
MVAAATVKSAAGQAKPGCSDACGDLNIPYPFGAREGCYRDKNFFISCDTFSAKPIANYSTGNIQVFHISLDGQSRSLAATPTLSLMIFGEEGSPLAVPPLAVTSHTLSMEVALEVADSRPVSPLAAWVTISAYTAITTTL